MTSSSQRPYFLWDYNLTDADIKKIIRGGNEVEKQWMIGRILTSARYQDIWKYLTINDIVSEFPNLRLRPGVKQAWQRALNTWGYDV